MTHLWIHRIYIYISVCVCVCVCVFVCMYVCMHVCTPRSVIILYFVHYRIHNHKIVAGTIDEYKSICMRYEPIARLCASGCCYV